jgi:hypothetical protein
MVAENLTVDRASQLLEQVEDPVLQYDPERGPTMQEWASFNRQVHNVVYLSGLMPVLRKKLETVRSSEEKENYCRSCMLLDRFLVDDPDPRLVGVV